MNFPRTVRSAQRARADRAARPPAVEAGRRPAGPLRQTDGIYGLAHPQARGLNPFAPIRVQASEHGQP